MKTLRELELDLEDDRAVYGEGGHEGDRKMTARKTDLTISGTQWRSFLPPTRRPTCAAFPRMTGKALDAEFAARKGGAVYGLCRRAA